MYVYITKKKKTESLSSSSSMTFSNFQFHYYIISLLWNPLLLYYSYTTTQRIHKDRRRVQSRNFCRGIIAAEHH